MKPGTATFVPARLREARIARGMTITTLAEIIGVTKQAVSQYETGRVTPHPEVMGRIAVTLNMPLHFFSMPVESQEAERGPVFFRSMNAATKLARDRADYRLRWLRRLTKRLEAYVELPAVNFPDLNTPADINAISDDYIEEAAEATRLHWGLGLGPISHVVRLMERNGVVVSRIDLEADALDALSDWIDSRPYTILNSSKKVAVRSRLDGAHELGHMVLHRNVDPKRLSRTDQFALMERQAFRFASAFLMPAASFANDVSAPGSLESFMFMKSKWLCSIQAMVKRAQSLDLISDEHAIRLWKRISRLGWRIREPLDDEIPVEEPSLLRRCCELIVERGGKGRSELLAEVSLAPRDVVEMASLPTGFFDEPVPDIRPLNASGKVVQFPRRTQ